MTGPGLPASATFASAPPVRIALDGGTGPDGVKEWSKTVLSGGLVAHFCGVLNGADMAALADRLDAAPDEAACRAALELVSGQFALVLSAPDWTLAAVDRYRSRPLIWAAAPDGVLAIAQTRDGLFGEAAVPVPKIDTDQALAVACCGYTTGGRTIYRSIEALLPGQFLLSTAQSGAPRVSTASYHRYRPWRAGTAALPDSAGALAALEELTLSLLAETVELAGGRTIAAPLSAGLDSRLIVSGLKKLGYRNVVCFAYGRAGNREAVASKAISERLGYPWHFVPYSNSWMADWFRSEAYDRFRRYSDSLTGVHFPQDFPAISDLKARGILPSDALVVNGQSGDFLTGNHIPKALQSEDGQAWTGESRRLVLDALRKKHFKLWRGLDTPSVHARIDALLERDIEALIGDEDPGAISAFGVYEGIEFVNRQCKYVVNGQRCYEALGLDWDLPLWRDSYIDYWADMPLPPKRKQSLYREMLTWANWAGVWRDIPVNELRIQPAWIRPVRLIAKIAHAPLGKSAWHRFEQRYLDYFMTPLCGYSLRDWSNIAFHPFGPKTAISCHVEHYLASHGISLEAVSAAAGSEVAA